MERATLLNGTSIVSTNNTGGFNSTAAYTDKDKHYEKLLAQKDTEIFRLQEIVTDLQYQIDKMMDDE